MENYIKCCKDFLPYFTTLETYRVDGRMNQSKKEKPVNTTSELTLEEVKQLFLYVPRL